MGFALTVLYFINCYLTPVTLFGPLARYRIELILAILLLLISAPRMMRSFVFRTPQALALAGLAVAVFSSVLVGAHWPGGAVNAFVGFIPNIYAYFILCLHCNSRRKLYVVVLMMLLVCLFVIANGAIDLHRGLPAGGPPVSVSTGAADIGLWNLEHPYVLAMKDDAGEWFYRLRGLGEINDPNDFGQLLICVIPLLFIFWRRKKRLFNIAFVILPCCLLQYGIYLTHSRGALVALVAVVLVAARRRIGAVPAAIVAGLLFAGAMALHFTGGRAISAGAGADRTELWGESLQILKSYPVFGIGYAHLSEYIGHTAHNSVVVCAVELGLFGLFFWSLFLLSTVRSSLLIASPKNVHDARNPEAEDGLLYFRTWKGTALGKTDINRLGFCLTLSLTGFLAAGWFLSRATVMTFFLLGGLSEIVYETARRQGMVSSRLPLAKSLIYSAALTVSLVAVVYVMLRIVNLMH